METTSSCSSEDMQIPMYEKGEPLKMVMGSISHTYSNVSVVYIESRNIYYASVAHRAQVYIASFDSKMENVNWDTIRTNCAWHENAPIVTHAALVVPAVRVLPLLVIGTNQGVQIFDVRNQKHLAGAAIERPTETNPREIRIELHSFCRGITCIENLVVIGNYRGHLMQFVVHSESGVTQKKTMMEHNSPIMDIATCKFDEVTCSADAGGEIIVWTKPLRAVSSRLNAGECITAINVLRKHVIAGCISGNIMLFSIMNSTLVAKVNAHARPISSLDVAPESAYILSGSEDGRFIVFKLHTRKPGPFQVEYRFSEEIDHSMISGCRFTTGRGSCVAVACFDRSEILIFRIVKKSAQQV